LALSDSGHRLRKARTEQQGAVSFIYHVVTFQNACD
jgi:hypothetical protein